MTSSKDDLHKLIENLVIAQGNTFVKELLRSKNLRIGTSKSTFLESLHKAIDSNELKESDLDEWLSSVEGWGSHNVYLFRANATKLKALLINHENLELALTRANLIDIFNNPTPHAFPSELSETSVRRDDHSLQVIWHQRLEGWSPEPEMDFEQIIQDEEYRFKASRKKFERRLARLVLRSDIGLVAFFIDIPVSEKEAHDAAFKLLERTAKVLLPTVILKPVDIGQAQLMLDKGNTSPGISVATKRSRIHSPGAYVEFGSTSVGDYKDIAVVREVRRAAQSKLIGQSGDFIFSLPSSTKKSRNIFVHLNATLKRIDIRSQLHFSEEWLILQKIAEQP